MHADHQTTQDPVVAKIRALLLAARPLLKADGRELGLAVPEEPSPRGQPIPDPSPAIARMREHLQSLRTAVLAVSGGGPTAAGAQELTALTLLQTDQSLEKLAQAYAAPDPASATELRGESVRLVKQARSTSVKAGKALGIPWPL
jgi:hypothetical protein